MGVGFARICAEQHKIYYRAYIASNRQLLPFAGKIRCFVTFLGAHMQILSETDVKQGFGAALDAAQRGPVVIQTQDRDVAVLLSVQDYEKLCGRRAEVFDRLTESMAAKAAARGLTDETFARLMSDVS